MKKFLLSLLCLAGMSASAETYQLCTSLDEILNPENQFLIVSNALSSNSVMAMTNAAKGGAVAILDNQTAVPETFEVDVTAKGLGLFSFKANGTYSVLFENTTKKYFGLANTNALGNTETLPTSGNTVSNYQQTATFNAETNVVTVVSQTAKDTRSLQFQSTYCRNYKNNSSYGKCLFYKLADGTQASVAKPVFSIAAGSVEEGQTVEISCETEGAEIFYTLDGTTPDNTSTKYTEALTINATTTVKAIAYVGEEKSSVASATYTVVSLDTFAEILDLENGAKFAMGTPLTVVYAPAGDTRYVYVYADGLYSLLYKANLGLKEGDVIKKGWTGKVSIYSGLFELVPDAATLETTGETGTIPTFATVEAADVTSALVNNIVVIKNVVFNEATLAVSTTNFAGTVGNTELTFRNTFKIDSVEAGTYNVTCVVSVFDKGLTTPGTTLQLLPKEYEKVTTGIADIEADSNVAPVFYNLQGVRVANPENGMFIEVRGNKAVKVIK